MNRIYWIYGKPGSGKTELSYKISGRQAVTVYPPFTKAAIRRLSSRAHAEWIVYDEFDVADKEHISMLKNLEEVIHRSDEMKMIIISLDPPPAGIFSNQRFVVVHLAVSDRQAPEKKSEQSTSLFFETDILQALHADLREISVSVDGEIENRKLLIRRDGQSNDTSSEAKILNALGAEWRKTTICGDGGPESIFALARRE